MTTVTHAPIQATRIHPIPTSDPGYATCKRCGINRAVHQNHSPICRDCRDTMSLTERRVWTS